MYGSATQRHGSAPLAETNVAGSATAASGAKKLVSFADPYQQDWGLFNFLRSLGPERLGLAIFASGAFFHLAMDLGLLLSYCNKFGCMLEGCTAWRPNQCLPSYSDTLLVYDEDPSSVARHWVMLVICCIVYSVMEPLLLCVGYRLLVENTGASEMHRVVIFDICMVFGATFDLISTALPNRDATGYMHRYLSCALIGLWLGAIVPLFIMALSSKPEVPRMGLAGIWAVWSAAALITVWLMVSWHWMTWDWYVFEWLDIVSHGLAIMLLGSMLRYVKCGQKEADSSRGGAVRSAA